MLLILMFTCFFLDGCLGSRYDEGHSPLPSPRVASISKVNSFSPEEHNMSYYNVSWEPLDDLKGRLINTSTLVLMTRQN